MPSAYEIVMQKRKELVKKIIENMEQGRTLIWDKWHTNAFAALAPRNPLSGIAYKGGNRLRLMDEAMDKSYSDPRWMTFKQIKDAGYRLKKESKGTGVACEKWIFFKEVKKEIDGKIERVKEELDSPRVNYFTVYNAMFVEDLPPLPLKKIEGDFKAFDLADEFITTSECKVEELAQDRAYYDLKNDKICLPLREYFKDDISFFNTLLHEMGHSTGHPDRLNRELKGGFGSELYAKEELRAELASYFLEADLGLDLEQKHVDDHTIYLESWIKALKSDYNELFRACSDAEKISSRLKENYNKVYKKLPEIEKVQENVIQKRKKVR